MKIQNTLIISALACFSLASCEILERTSPNDIDASTVFTDAQSAEYALTGLYSSMQVSEYYGGLFTLAPDCVTDDMSTGGFDDPSLDELGENFVTTQNLYAEEIWLAIYRTIANANYLLEGMDGIDPSLFEEGRQAQIEGEARAIRAWAHFDLLRLYGEHWDVNSYFGIPIVSSVQTIEEVLTRSAVGENYSFIVQELEASLGLVSEERTPGYVDAVSVHAMLSKVFLYQKDFAQAADHATQVIDSGEFALYDADNLEELYRARRNAECVFELVFDNQNRSSYNSLTYVREDALNTELFAMAEASLASFFEGRPGDVRSEFLNFNPDENDPSIQPDGRSEKYRGEETRDNPAYILRLADLYLIRAEALGLAAGVADLNTVRTSRGLEPLDPAAMTAEDYQNAILDERRAELNFEGNRLFDLARTQTFESVLEADAFRAIFPIPLREVKATEGLLIQNKGY